MANDLEIIDKHRLMVLRRCWYLLFQETYGKACRNNFANPPEDVKDAIQEVFFKFFRVKANNPSLFEKLQLNDKLLSTYIYKIASNVCLNMLKKKKFPLEPIGDDIADDNYEKIEYKQDKAELLAKKIRAIKTLMEGEDEMTRNICNMYHFNKMKVKDIVKAVGLEKSQVYNIINKFKGKIRSKLGKKYIWRGLNNDENL